MIKKSIYISIFLTTLLCFSLINAAFGSQKDMNTKHVENSSEEITFGGGCFWCTESIYLEINGVKKVESGYAGGSVINPSYEEVCAGSTGHAEVVQVTFNPQIISLEKIIQIFFATHNPTTLNRQGADFGTQYRSIIFYRNKQQKMIIEKVITELKKLKAYKDPIVTEVVPFTSFYRAEDYHQKYFEQNPDQAYCRIIIKPKLEKFRKVFRDNLK
jgi:methionine-S-sulfoxide reductase